jgi:reactive intermediate/imine deaminase
MNSLHAKRTVIHTNDAPQPIGSYSQAIKVGNTIYFSGQIGLDPKTGLLVDGGFEAQSRQAFKNLQAVALAAGASLDDVTKVNIYVINLDDFSILNSVMAEYVNTPYPARSTVQVAALPKGALVEIEATAIVR